MPIYALGEMVPQIHPGAYVHPDAVLIGNVSVGDEASVWPGAVLRGDAGPISIGARTSIQDGTVIHVTATSPTRIGAGCVVGHLAHLEGCTVEDGVLVGSGAGVLPGALGETGSLVAAGAVVAPGLQVPPRSMVRGVPARISPGVIEVGAFAETVEVYVERGKLYAATLRRLS